MKLCLLLYVSAVLYGVESLSVRNDISCKDNDGNNVPWFILYKTPQTRDNTENGYKYYYMDSENQKWVAGVGRITENNNALSRTLQTVYQNRNPEKSAYLLYNNEPPHPNSKAGDMFGMTKGVVSFDEDGGYWLSHSVPDFPPKSSQSYSYPGSALKHGHVHLCISLKKGKIDELWNQFLYTVPYVYDESVPKSMTTKDLETVLDRRHVDNMVTEPKNRMVFTSVDGQEFMHFAKSGQFGKDIYDGWLAPYFRSDFFAQIGKRTTADMKSTCHENVKTLNVQQIKIGDVEFPANMDHSKWGITVAKKWVCIGDGDRSTASLTRGGGLVCLKNAQVWKQFEHIVKNNEKCKKAKPGHDEI